MEDSGGVSRSKTGRAGLTYEKSQEGETTG